MTPSYRYLLCDLLTDQILAVLPLSGVSFTRAISRVGSLAATLTASTPGQVKTAKMLYAYAGRSALWVQRGNAIWWGGIPWTVVPTQDARGAVSLNVNAATFDSYAHHRIFDQSSSYTQWDQNQLVASLWRVIQRIDGDHAGDPRGNIGVEAEYGQPSLKPQGILRDRTYRLADQAFAGKLIEDLGDVIDGPEHTIDTWVDQAGTRHKTLRVQTRIGVAQPRHVFQRVARSGGRVISWEHAADATEGGTRFWARGDAPNGNVGEDVPPLLSTPVERLDLLTSGWPILDVTEDRPGVIQKGTLDGFAAGMAQERGGSLPTSTYTVDVGNTGWSPNRLGDAVRFKLDDAWHTSTDIVARPVACTVQAAEKGRAETVALTLAEPEEA